jgi:hypothetical protein
MDQPVDPLSIVARYQNSPPVNLDAIARDLGIIVHRVPLGPGISGQLLPDRNDGSSGFSIYINSSEHPNRQRFTLAHELAHFILHRDLIDSGVVDDTMYRSQLSDVYEVQANRMAADILMPLRLVRAYRAKKPNVGALADIFRVSSQAMQIRLDVIDRMTHT